MNKHERETNMPLASLNSAFMNFSNIYDERVLELKKRLDTLTELEQEGKTSYTGADLNLIESCIERLCDENLKEEDLYEIERLIIKFL
jgi:hypothetical protein